ncbi:hypothetical protein CEXT_168561 [Caerostris extrusa]|uniref:Uncharacterized protein n=1 Tax=Caerostris extrusa TaxID=172846 RepID=A0AAV4PEH8_CAEEX|nr:hypothetical protein CEXT_168561 [Caerostris extrusa]
MQTHFCVFSSVLPPRPRMRASVSSLHPRNAFVGTGNSRLLGFNYAQIMQQLRSATNPTLCANAETRAKATRETAASGS